MADGVFDSHHPFARGSAPLPSDQCWVFKLGGSLLDQPDLAERVRSVIRRVSKKPLLVVGGGAAADVVRHWDQVHHLDPTAAHWQALRAMAFNQHLIETLLPEAVRVSRLKEAGPVWEQNRIALLDALPWLQREEGAAQSLPHSWKVTSDSIAAWAAIRWQAAGLLLLKSTDAPASLTAMDKNGQKVVDEYFSHLAPQLPHIAWCNLLSLPGKIITYP